MVKTLKWSALKTLRSSAALYLGPRREWPFSRFGLVTPAWRAQQVLNRRLWSLRSVLGSEGSDKKCARSEKFSIIRPATTSRSVLLNHILTGPENFYCQKSFLYQNC
jgi:hypothetical protein